MSDIKPCTSCAEPILAQATVCKHCQRAQGWRGQFNDVVAALPLVIALFSAIAFVLAFAKPWFVPPQSELIATFQRYANERISFVVTNAGERAGTIEYTELYFRHKDGGGTSFRLPVGPNDETLIRPSSEVRVSTMTPDDLKQLIWSAYLNKGDDNCLLTLRMVNSNGARDALTTETPCWQATIAVLPEKKREIIESLPKYSQ